MSHRLRDDGILSSARGSAEASERCSPVHGDGGQGSCAGQSHPPRGCYRSGVHAVAVFPGMRIGWASPVSGRLGAAVQLVFAFVGGETGQRVDGCQRFAGGEAQQFVDGRVFLHRDVSPAYGVDLAEVVEQSAGSQGQFVGGNGRWVPSSGTTMSISPPPTVCRWARTGAISECGRVDGPHPAARRPSAARMGANAHGLVGARFAYGGGGLDGEAWR